MVETGRRGPDIAATEQGRPARERSEPPAPEPAGRIEDRPPGPNQE